MWIHWLNYNCKIEKSWKCRTIYKFYILKNCHWLEGTTGKYSWFSASQLGIRFKWNQWKWFAISKSRWTKDLNMTRNWDWFGRKTTPKFTQFDACQFWICIKWNR
jgi:hypothetical protein